ncbi:GntR family transcriptional regulator [Halomonas denitrificans]|uniref:GntR family transcriptional regulator n=1 Tax=Halomonas TaxID=2745 RepID=UPI001C951C5C|nr:MULTISPECIES: GntR family transcriptional regulator [Halomonas]MBY5928807.1 GntR family transcriptional regulator [Halomonas sp. DP8Y7-3]MCA0974239.1 GntR family transcriptional regulator [Halomonas denitrificans]
MSTDATSSPHEKPEALAEELVYDRIVDALIDKRLRPGERLNEAKLATAFNTPRSRVRRALNRLTAERLVRFEMHRGAFVSLPSVKEAYDIFETRLHIEAAVARIACERIDASGIATLRQHLALEHQVFEERKPSVNRISGDFHLLLAELTGNEELIAIVRPIIRRFCIIQSLYERPSGVLCLTHEHQSLVDMIEAGDAEGAAQSMMEHCRHIFYSLELSEQRRAEANIYDIATDTRHH